MHLLQSGVALEVIALWLGHERPTTTHGYFEADLKMKEESLRRLERVSPARRPRREPASRLLGGHEELAAMFGGGVGRSQFPAHAVRWENAGCDLAVWVQEATLTRFRARAYSFAAAEKPVAMQHWRLHPGLYRLTLTPNQPGVLPLSSRAVELRHRGDSIPLNCPRAARSSWN